MRHPVRMGFVVLLLAMVVSAVGATSAVAAKDARLEGKFKVTVTVISSNITERVGQQLVRTYTFSPQCKKRVCKKVRFARESASGCCVNSTLRRVGKGVYESTEVNLHFTCLDGSSVDTGTSLDHIEIKKAKKGHATRIAGTLSFDGGSSCFTSVSTLSGGLLK